MDKSGKMLILAILAIALASGGFSWWFRWSATHRAAEFWGPEAAKTIRDADSVRAVKSILRDPKTFEPYPGEKEIWLNVTKAGGLLHLKHALMLDRSFDWKNAFSRSDLRSSDKFLPRWNLNFSVDATPTTPSSSVSLYFDEAFEYCTFREGGIREPLVVPCNERLSSGLNELFSEWFTDASN